MLRVVAYDNASLSKLCDKIHMKNNELVNKGIDETFFALCINSIQWIALLYFFR